jgi:hypothetical protein
MRPIFVLCSWSEDCGFQGGSGGRVFCPASMVLNFAAMPMIDDKVDYDPLSSGVSRREP